MSRTLQRSQSISMCRLSISLREIVKHILSDGTKVTDVKGYRVNREDHKDLYTMLGGLSCGEEISTESTENPHRKDG